MSKLTKNQKLVADKIEAGKAYTLKEAATLVKEITTTKFDASLDIDVRLGVDPRKANQMVRGVVSRRYFICSWLPLTVNTFLPPAHSLMMLAYVLKPASSSQRLPYVVSPQLQINETSSSFAK